MYTKILLLICAIFYFVNLTLAKLELVLATIQEPTTEHINVDQAARIFASGGYLADKYKKQFQIDSTSFYTDKDVDVIATISKKSKQSALLFKQGVLSKNYWRYKEYSQSDYEYNPTLYEMLLWEFKPNNDEELAKVAELDKKFLVYDSNCPALDQEFANEEKHECLSALVENHQKIKTSQYNNPTNEIFNSMLRNMDFDSKMKRLSAGPLLNAIMENIHQKSNSTANEKTNQPKIFLYVLPPELMSFLILSFSVPGTRYNEQDLEDQINPKLGSLFVLELHSNYTQNEDEWTIKLQYRNEDNDVLQSIRLPDCGIKCPVRFAYEKLKPYMTSDEDMKKECEAK